jgi:hypothetical protein
LDFRADVERFERDLIEQAGELTAVKRAAVLAAVTAYRALQLANTKLTSARRQTRHLEELVGMLPPLVGSLLRSLRALGLENDVPAGDDAEPAPGSALAKYLASRDGAEAEAIPDGRA